MLDGTLCEMSVIDIKKNSRGKVSCGPMMLVSCIDHNSKGGELVPTVGIFHVWAYIINVIMS